ncbi:MAG TPA: rRNA maturation RNase YbeY [Thermodesulfobacteriota bacterium]|nr:rRNA maturation RNase YbeY [Thermodesulfobacteriota bacterium]HNU70989.1 rRNA maturation RNase YbeY [Thermodesulfobacteriota bacterium]HOC38135.1 rRNA maturation RNase YbeY [Thermodesulfobacteriota bacterium]
MVTGILNALGSPDVEMGVSLVSDRAITDLNATYRNHNRPTDVLSFSMQEGDFGDLNPQVLGDVVISVETARRQAEERGQSFEEELCLLLIHGTLHLFGYDHERSAAAARQMRGKERTLLRTLKKEGIL